MNIKHSFLRKVVLCMGTALMFLAANAQDASTDEPEQPQVTVTAQGPRVGGAVYGGGRKADVGGNALVEVKSTLVLADTTDPEQGVGHVYGGNDIAGRVKGTTTVNLNGGRVMGNVFGGGNGDYGCSNASGNIYVGSRERDTAQAECVGPYHRGTVEYYLNVPVAWKTVVNVVGTVDVRGALYGGGNMAAVGVKAICADGMFDTTNTPPCTSGTWCAWCDVDEISATLNLTSGTIGTIYGGGRMAPIYGESTINFTEQSVLHVRQDVYAGNDIANRIAAADVTDGVVLIQGAPQIKGAVFGGGNGDYEYTETAVYKNGLWVADLCVPAGCADTTARFASPRVKSGSVTLAMQPVGGQKGHVGTIYGGGNAALVKENTTVSLVSGQVDNVFGGGRRAPVLGTATVSTSCPAEGECLAGALVIGNLFGGNDITESVRGGSSITIDGKPQITNLFGGGNGNYNYATGPYAGLTAPDQARTTVLIKGDPRIATAYAGGNNATITGSTTLTFRCPTDNTGSATNLHVGTLFGGNNLAAMRILPNLELESGYVGTVYGGGNQGDMLADQVKDDTVRHVATYVLVDSPDIHIVKDLYGGCRAANVGTPGEGEAGHKGSTYVHIKQGEVNRVFGGNDVAKTCHYARTYVTGGTVKGMLFGGSNGMYDYAPDGKIYEYGHLGEANHLVADVPGAGRAAVDSSRVLLTGGTLEGNVYGGGLAGNGGYAYTRVEGDANLQAQLFGAGRGDVVKIGQCVAHLGNITDKAVSDLISLNPQSTLQEVYGGGHSGDAVNTQLNIKSTFQPADLQTIYGGAYAGHISGLAQTHIEGAPDVKQAGEVYGGNNFGGYVDRTELTIERGQYDYIYGAGNGAYNYKNELSPGLGCYDTVPYSGHITLNLGLEEDKPEDKKLYVSGKVYGGGNLGVVRTFDQPTADQSLTDAITSATKVEYGHYGDIVMNVYSGHYHNHIFGGARGREVTDPTFGKKRTYGEHHLAFAYKQVNVYNCFIEHSLYGGSEAVNDGYPWEFRAKSQAMASVDLENLPDGMDSDNLPDTLRDGTETLRPTGVVNIMGGLIRKNVYGGGYLGYIYGSVYCNVGVKAVDSSYVWTRVYGTPGGTDTMSYGHRFKPAMRDRDLYLQASLYVGSDWGEAGANAVFNTRGFFGGESQIYVDGKGYNTGATPGLSAMDIHYSLFGAGTSTAGGDRWSDIYVRHYGEEVCLDGRKGLFSIQRANRVLLDSVFLYLQGEQDAYRSYASPDYTFNRIDTLIFRGHNTVTLQDPANYIGNIRSEVKHRFFNPDDTNFAYLHSPLVTAAQMQGHDIGCTDQTDFCQQVNTGQKDNKLIMENGIYVSVLGYEETYNATTGRALGENGNSTYGNVDGYMLLLAAQDGTKSYVYAATKPAATSNDQGAGGFLGICSSQNTHSPSGDTTEVLPYENSTFPVAPGQPNIDYRVWNVGERLGLRNRSLAIIANANPDAELCYDERISNLPTGFTLPEDETLAVAHGSVQLPPTEKGHYYAVNSITVDADNGGQVKLVGGAYDNTSTNPQWHFNTTAPSDAAHNAELQAILNDPTYTFGLWMGSGEHFGSIGTSTEAAASRVVDGSVLNAGNYYQSLSGLITKQVGDNEPNGVMPTFDFDLAYSTGFNTTILRQMVIEVWEYKDTTVEENGVERTYRVPLAPINITVTLQTVLQEFKDIEITLLAMYNEGQFNTYSRKVVLPATFKHRTLFLTNVEWFPDSTGYRTPCHDCTTGEGTPPANYYKLVDKGASKPTIDLFGITLKPEEYISEDIANTLGWYDIAADEFDVHQLGQVPNDAAASWRTNPVAMMEMGTLDGRATAALTASLHFNGKLTYLDDDTLGFVVLHYKYPDGYDQNGAINYGDFNVKIRVKSRSGGDTIYLASKEGGFSRKVPAGRAGFVQGDPSTANTDAEYGKRPSKYVTTFEDALKIYRDGDVICIIDTVEIRENKLLTINGIDSMKLQIIRYSGSHNDAPGLDNAYYGPMIRVGGDARFTAKSCWFNGSGITRTKRKAKDANEQEAVYGHAVIDDTNTVNRLPDVLWAKAPMIVVEDGGVVTLRDNTELSNNFNGIDAAPAEVAWGRNFCPGGAALLNGTRGKTPTLIVGNGVAIHDNLINGASHKEDGVDVPTVNRGAGIYNNNGTIQLGIYERGGDSIVIVHNYSLGTDPASSDNSSFTTKKDTVRWAKEPASGVWNKRELTMAALSFDNGHYVETFTSRNSPYEKQLVPMGDGDALSNVFLTRLHADAPDNSYLTYENLNDKQTDLVVFKRTLHEKSRVGITKWFPGGGKGENDYLCRDTIQIARVVDGAQLYAQENFDNRVFFDDSVSSYVFWHSTVAPNNIFFQRCASFRQRTTAKDRYVNGVDETRGINDDYIWTIGDENVEPGLATTYRLNPDSKCSAMLDTLQYRLQGGFYPYSYYWQCAPVTKYDKVGVGGDHYRYYTTAPSETNSDGGLIDWSSPSVRTVRETKTPYDNTISNRNLPGNEAKRLASSMDSCVTIHLAMVPTLPSLDYTYRVVGYDLTNNCPVPQELDIRVVRTDNSEYNDKTSADWLAKEKIEVHNPGYDSNLVAEIGVKKVDKDIDSTRIRYLRVCKGVHLGTDVIPTWNDGYITFVPNYIQNSALNDLLHDGSSVTWDGNIAYDNGTVVIRNATGSATLKEQFFCPGDVLTVSTLKTLDEDNQPLTTSQFMMWDFDPQAPAENVTFTMPDRDYDIKAIYAPGEHWWRVVTSLRNTDDDRGFMVGYDVNGTEIWQQPDYHVDYDGNVTIGNEAGLAWLISNTNGLNYQRAQEFHNKTITLLPKEGGYKMGQYLWTPLGTQSNPFSGHFEGGNIPVESIIVLEDNLTYVGFFGNVGHDTIDHVTDPGYGSSASVNELHLDKLMLKGNNYVGGIAAVVNNNGVSENFRTHITNNVIENSSLMSGAYMVGGIAAQVNGAVNISDNTVDKVDFLGNATYVGGIVAVDKEIIGLTTDRTQCDETRYVYGIENHQYFEVSPSPASLEDNIEGPVEITIHTVDGPNGSYDEVVPVAGNQYVFIEVTGEEATTGYKDFNFTICTRMTTGSAIMNNNVYASTDKMSSSGVAGGTLATTSTGTGGAKGGLFHRGKASDAPQTYVANNYVRFRTGGNGMIVGGLMGQAANTDLVNNYVYGEVESQNAAGALVGYVGGNVNIDRCYYQEGTSGSVYGSGRAKGHDAVTSFKGTANQVRMEEKLYGTDNLTRALNNWALAQQRYGDTNVLTWRSDFENWNNGLPVFGRPDIIYVVDSARESVCDSYLWQGETYLSSAVFTVHMVDSVRFLDSTLVMTFDLGHSQQELFSDTVQMDEGYYDHGFSLSSDDLAELMGQADRDHYLCRTVELIDSLLTAHGCDSVVRLSLTIYPKQGIEEATLDEVPFEVSVYPNPTAGALKVECEESRMERLELFDMEGRVVLRSEPLNSQLSTLNLDRLSTGAYYLRITTEKGVAIKKVVKK